MVDPGTGLTILGTAIGGGKLIEKVLGPTAEYLGAGVKDWTEKRVAQTKRIFETASKKLGDSPPDGAVPPRVLRDVLNDGSLRDDDVSTAYYGGILASSRSEIPRDDRAAAFSALIGRLTSYQLRAHFVFYRTFYDLFHGNDLNLLGGNARQKCRFFIPIDEYMSVMDLSSGEDHNAIFSHVVYGLHRESLIDDRFGFGGSDALKSCKNIPEGSKNILIPPAALGVELFLWSNGHATSDANEILRADLDFKDVGIGQCKSAQRCNSAT